MSRIARALFAFSVFVATATAQNAVVRNLDYADTGPRTLLVTYRCEPSLRPSLQDYFRGPGRRQLDAWRDQGAFASYRLLFNWFVDDKTWDAMLVLHFETFECVAKWRVIERRYPGGLLPHGAKLARPLTTTSADVVWQRENPKRALDPSASVFLAIPYRYLTLVQEYIRYCDGYVIPQLDGWLEHDVLRSYQVLLNRYPTGDRWGSLLLLEYRSLEAFGKRKQTKYAVREKLRENAEWVRWSKIKRTLRSEREPVITEQIAPSAEKQSGENGDDSHGVPQPSRKQVRKPTREFEIRGDRPYLGGQPVELWGIRCGNALHSKTVTERHVRALDDMVRHGINLIGVYLQGSNGGWPDPAAGLNGFDHEGRLKSSVADRLEWLVREADARGMVVMVGVCSPRKDQDFADDEAIRRGMQSAARTLVERGLRNVFVDLMHEFGHRRVDKDMFREPDGASKKAQLTAWFKEVAPNIEVGVSPYQNCDTLDRYPGMEVRMIQKEMPIPDTGFVVNVETQKQDCYENDGVFNEGARQHVFADCARFLAEPRAAMMLHAGFIQGIGNYSGTAPHPEMGGHGTGVSDRGVRFYYEWVRDHVGTWVYPRHVLRSREAAPEDAPTRDFAVRDGLPSLDGKPVRLWGLRCHNALLSDAVAQRLVHAMDDLADHGINLIGVSLQGTNSGFPQKELGPNAYAPDGRLLRRHADRLEFVVREANRRSMVVCLTLMMPRKDQLLRDESAVRRAIEETARLLQKRGLRNVCVNLYQEFDHPSRADHDIFREPGGAEKKQRMTRWFKEQAPDVEIGVCPNHQSGSSVDYPGCEVLFFQEKMPIPSSGFAINTETADRDLSGNAGVFNRFHIESMQREWSSYLTKPNAAFLFRSPYLESVRGVLGTGPNFAFGGSGTKTSDRGIRPYFDWLKEHVGAWRYPRHELEAPAHGQN